MIKKLWLKVKKYLPWILAVVLLISLVTGLLYKQRLDRAALTQAVLIEKARILEADRNAIREKFNLLGKASTIKITVLQKTITEKDSASQLIVVKQANEIKALRFTVGSWEDRYNRLEPEALQLSAKVGALEGVIEPLKQANAELEIRDLIRLEHIGELEGKLGECQNLLKVSIANTNSILKKGWLFKLFGNIKVGPGGGFSIAGNGSVGMYAIWAIN